MTSRATLNGKRILAKDLNKEDRKKTFLCDTCGDILIPKMGKIRAWHFAHKNLQDHSNEPETDEHREMKYYLLSEYEKLGYKSDIEVGIKTPEKLHEADVVVYEGNHHTPLVKGVIFECQCSPINVDEIQDRNNHYLKNGYVPIWILGSKYIEQINNNKTSLIEEYLLKDFGVIFTYENSRINFLNEEKKKYELSPNMLLQASLRKINNLSWMPLEVQIKSKLSFKNGMGFHQKIDGKYISLLDIYNFIIDMTNIYSNKDIFQLSDNEYYNNNEELYIILKNIGNKYISKIYKLPYKCWVCHKDITVYIETVWLANRYVDSRVPMVSSKYPNIKKRYYNLRDYEVVNYCPYCGRVQGKGPILITYSNDFSVLGEFVIDMFVNDSYLQEVAELEMKEKYWVDN